MRVAFWKPSLADAEIIPNAMERLEAAGRVLAEKTRANLRAKIRVGNISRPVAKSGKYAGKSWTARNPGALLKTVRVVRKKGDTARNVWVMVGNYDVYYGQMFEYATDPKKGGAFFRPAIAQSKSGMKDALENGTGSSPVASFRSTI